MTLPLIRSLWICLAVAVAGWAQSAGHAGQDQTESGQAPAVSQPEGGNPFPVDIAGYLSFRYLNDDELTEHRFYPEYSGSLFLSKTAGRWRFHSEINATTATEFDVDGIHLVPRRPSLSVDLETASANYNARDWLQFQAGFLFIPTYWRFHRYQSNTLTVDDPLIDRAIFPTSFKGGAIHGDWYFGHGGISYEIYGGVDQLVEFQSSSREQTITRSRVTGGKLSIHVPTRRHFKTLDFAVHRLYRSDPRNAPDGMYGLELQAAKGRWELLAEYEHASMDIVDGRRSYLRDGYYIQQSLHVAPRWFLVTRRSELDRDSRYTDLNNSGRWLLGVVYRPTPAISLKIEGDRSEPHGIGSPAYYGVRAALVYFFHRP